MVAAQIVAQISGVAQIGNLRYDSGRRMSDLAKKVMARIEALARVSEEPGRLTRTFCSPSMRRANDLVGQWMRGAGMTVREDVMGNLIGHYAAQPPNFKFQIPDSKFTGLPTPRPAAKILLLVS